MAIGHAGIGALSLVAMTILLCRYRGPVPGGHDHRGDPLLHAGQEETLLRPQVCLILSQ
jgi:hypothetical protein